MTDIVLPPLDGSLRTFLDFVDFHATHNPNHPWFVFPSTRTPGTQASVTFGQVAASSHAIAHLLRPERQDPRGQTLGLLLHTDPVIYIPVLLGALRAGFVASLTYSISWTKG